MAKRLPSKQEITSSSLVGTWKINRSKHNVTVFCREEISFGPRAQKRQNVNAKIIVILTSSFVC